MHTKKMKRLDHVVTVPQAASLADAAETMRSESVGCVVVVDDAGAPLGILTDRDIVLKAVARDAGPETRVSEVMSHPLETMKADSERADILSRMRALGIRRMPLTSDGRLTGFVSLDDLAFDLSLDMQQLTQALATSLRRARRDAHRDELSKGAEEALGELRSRLQYARWITRQVFLDELDEIREQVAKALKPNAS